MISTVELSDLLADLYAAPIEPEKWQVFFDRLCVLTDVASGYLVSVDPDDQNVVLAGGGNSFDAEVFRLYNEHYGARDPYRAPLTANPRLGVIQGEELVSQNALHKSELYNEVLCRFDMKYLTLLSGTCTTERADVFSLWRSPDDGPMDASGLNLLRLIAPHVKTALELRRRISLSHSLKDFSELTLDAISIAAFLVNGNGRIRHMNQLAARYLSGTDGLQLHHGRLTATDLDENGQLQLLIAGASEEKAASISPPGGAMKITRCLGRTSLQVAVVPAPERYRPAVNGSCAIVFVSDPSSQPRSRGTFMRQLYGLSPAEARLADLLLEGLDVREIADRARTTLETTRFQLKRVLSKTGTRRQAELMRLMLSLPG